MRELKTQYCRILNPRDFLQMKTNFIERIFLNNFILHNARVLYSTVFEALQILGLCPNYFYFNGFLMTLQILHYYWFYLICRVVISVFKHGKVRSNLSILNFYFLMN